MVPCSPQSEEYAMSSTIVLELSPADLAVFVAGLYKQGLRFTLMQTSVDTYHLTITGH
ncbi:hypothetical protein vBAspALolek_03 [Aeromonas phage vB_AspA_Lolek]|nr:hypothetical protein vBAspALolek_03 [Aeromonas phage vB_AspA_Lolek]